MHDSLTLSRLNFRIKESVNDSFPENFWITAEISEISTNPTGHCYLELIEKEENGDRIIARMRATIWAYTFRMLKPYFENTSGYKLTAGIKILVNGNVTFHEVYGLSLNIKDIDPTYTLGDFARKRIEIINRLTAEGVIDMNKQLQLPMIPQRIAIISSETAAGYGDFMNTLNNNIFNFVFKTTLFSAVMQGDKAVESIIHSLDNIYMHEDQFDVAVLIRGGGAQADLECFNNYDLAYHITQFPIPVLTGIGHERDETITDLVANHKLKTPTAVAEFLIDMLAAFLEDLQMYEQRLSDICHEIIREEKDRIAGRARFLSHIVNRRLGQNQSFLAGITRHAAIAISQYFEKKEMYLEQRNRLTFLYSSNLIERYKSETAYRVKNIFRSAADFISAQKKQLDKFQDLSTYLNPEHILKRGFSITLSNGKVIRDSSQLAEGEEITTVLYSGEVKSNVKQVILKKKSNG